MTLAVRSVNRAIASFHPRAMPAMARGHYRRELAAWVFLPVMLGVVEGSVVGVIAKNAFAGIVSATTLNFAVAVLTGAPAFAYVTSFIWASMSHGRHKIRFLVGLYLVMAALVAAVALAPMSATGLVLFTVGIVGARVCWSGVVTLRTTVWRANYRRAPRAIITGKLATVEALILAGVALGIGAAMSVNEQAFRVLYPLAAVGGLMGAWIYGRLRVRGHRSLVRAEQADTEFTGGLPSPSSFWRILRNDRLFTTFLACQFVFGIGNIMASAPLVIVLRDVMGLEYLGGILMTATIPLLIMVVTIPFWSKLFGRVHIVRYRAIHTWAFAVKNLLFLIASLTAQVWVMLVASLAHGLGRGGGALAWNLGHHDFAPRHLASQYMGVHVTLTGVRGIIAPFLAVGLYEMFERARPGAGAWIFAVCLGLNILGGIGFILLDREMKRRERTMTP